MGGLACAAVPVPALQAESTSAPLAVIRIANFFMMVLKRMKTMEEGRLCRSLNYYR
jgi:hypothetical protein